MQVFYEYYGFWLEIEQELVELYSCLWKNKFYTQDNCQINVPTNYIYIQFENVDVLQKFINSLDLEYNDPLYLNIFGVGNFKNEWIFNIKIEDDVIDWKDYYTKNTSASASASDTSNSKHKLKPAIVNISASVRFHKSDLDEIVSRLKKNSFSQPQN